MVKDPVGKLLKNLLVLWRAEMTSRVSHSLRLVRLCWHLRLLLFGILANNVIPYQLY